MNVLTEENPLLKSMLAGLKHEDDDAMDAEFQERAAKVREAGYLDEEAPEKGDADEKPKDAETELATAHAPKGGIAIAGQQFDGGQFIPAGVLAKATPEEKSRLEVRGGKGESGQQPAQVPANSTSALVPPDSTSAIVSAAAPSQSAPVPAPTIADHVKKAAGFLPSFWNALKGSPQRVRGKVERGYVQAKATVDNSLDHILKKALPEDIAEETRNAVLHAVLSTVQEHVLGAALADAPAATPTDWKDDLIVHMGPFVVVRAAFSLCKKIKTNLCSALAKAMP